MKSVAMTAKHVEALALLSHHADVEESMGRSQYGRSPKILREILELVRSLESGEAVVVERKQIEDIIENIGYGNIGPRTAAVMSGWLTSDTPKEKANAENPVSGSDR